MEDKKSTERVRRLRERDKKKYKPINIRVTHEQFSEMQSFMKRHSIKDYRGFIEFILSGKYASEIAHWELYEEISIDEYENDIEPLFSEKTSGW